MPRILSPREAEPLVAAGDVDVVDVREPDEWAAGHVPGARLVPLGELRDDPRAKLRGDRVLLVCARGSRSLTAAKLAEQAGLAEVYSLEGGTIAWADAGLPIERPQAPRREPAAASVPAASEDEPGGSSCGLPEPSLDAVVGNNLRELRGRRNLSLDALARQTGLGRALLGQIENGRVSPSVSVVWKLAQAFDVPFSALLSTPQRVATRVMRAAEARRLVSPDGRFSSRALYPLNEETSAEFYELFFAAHSREDAAAHRPGTKELLVVTAGKLEIEVGGERFELARGDAISFVADVPHSYINRGSEDCWANLVMTYVFAAPPEG
ncbi:rhodanese-like domain-containing protein [Nannocystis radixulma]|uniref:Helix-turn-helix domain-containing protein n=1 Tax=Nannocystis radixulma TaxID=2995305 RepID=A0ABT5B139_9BACT|nr:rhodanese-like domain-containing protein [Nannocystis radixulma]MDC0667819.1 helix-turn-helix domain-containing protein [Nannocystis radixulma]